MSLFDDLKHALQPDVELLREVSYMEHAQLKQPFYWPENIDTDGRHKNPSFCGHVDLDFCDDCKSYCGVAHWYGGHSVNDKGQVVPNEQVPLCEECERKELS
jgi:hypothetical protein